MKNNSFAFSKYWHRCSNVYLITLSVNEKYPSKLEHVSRIYGNENTMHNTP